MRKTSSAVELTEEKRARLPTLVRRETAAARTDTAIAGAPEVHSTRCQRHPLA